MDLKDLFYEEIAFFEEDLTSKDAVIDFIVQKLGDTKFTNNQTALKKAIYKREEQGSTAMGDGIAIPHVLNTSITKTAILFLKLKTKIEWEASDNQTVDLVFFIMTNNKSGDEHLEVLAQLAAFLISSDAQTNLRNIKNIKELKQLTNNKPQQNKTVSNNNHYDIIAVTACPTGIAHTYLAKEKLEEYANKKNMSIKVETQGRRGSENILTDEDISNAKVIILAHDKAIEGLSRFNGKKVIDTSTKKAIFNGDQLIDQYLNNTDLKEINVKSSSKNLTGELNLKKFLNVKANLLGGVSRMLPFVVGGGILLGIAFLIDFIAGNSEAGGAFGTINPAAGWFATIGSLSMSMMVPILGAYIAYAIVGPQGLLPGMIAGLLSSDIMGTAYGEVGEWSGMWARLLPDGIIADSGFIGAMVGGYLAALLVFGWGKAFEKFPKSLQGVRDIVFIPVITLLSIGVVMFAINIPLGFVTQGLQLGLTWLAENNLLVLVTALMGLMMCIDMGGPINKIAYTIGVLAVGGEIVVGDGSQSTILMAAVMFAGMLPPIMIAISTVLFSKAWTSDDKNAGKTNWLMGACFITEGAIPFMIKDPKRIAVTSMLGGLIIGILVGLLQIRINAPHGGIFTFALIDSLLFANQSVSIGVGIALSIVIIIGVATICGVILGIWRTTSIKKGSLILESTDGIKEKYENKIIVLNNKKPKNYDKKILKLENKISAYEKFNNK